MAEPSDNSTACAVQSGAPRQPVILLGASNLTIGWNSVLQALSAHIAAPLDVFTALGMGRSFVDWSSFGVRRLPGIVNSGLWDSLRSHHPEPRPPPLVLITDIGNDLVYGRSPDHVMRAVCECLKLLQDWREDCRIVLTGLPVESVLELSPLRFWIARTILFPGSSLRLPDVRKHAILLNELVEREAAAQQFGFVKPQREWYGIDPIHIRKPFRTHAFGSYFDPWFSNGDSPEGTDRLSSAIANAGLPRAEIRESWGRIRNTPQPCFENGRLRVFAF